MTDYIMVFCTCPDENSAKAIASQLIQAKIAACVNLIPGVQSIYCWQGKIEQATEVQLLIKTKTRCFEQINQLIRSIHPYDTPEILATPIVDGDNQYLAWIDSTVTAPNKIR
jgi:periplasmic divalent cation tolerance protein